MFMLNRTTVYAHEISLIFLVRNDHLGRATRTNHISNWITTLNQSFQRLNAHCFYLDFLFLSAISAIVSKIAFFEFNSSDRLRQFDEPNANVSIKDAMLTKSTERLNGHCGECCSRTCCPLRAHTPNAHTCTRSIRTRLRRTITADCYDLLLCVSFILRSDVRVVSRRVFIVKRAHTCVRVNVYVTINVSSEARRTHRNVMRLFPRCDSSMHPIQAHTVGHTTLGSGKTYRYFVLLRLQPRTEQKEENQKQTSSNTRFDGDSDAGDFLFFVFFTSSVDA